MTTAPPLPPAVWEKLRAFLDAGLTGQVQLDIRDGRILAYKLTEAGRVEDVPCKPKACVGAKR